MTLAFLGISLGRAGPAVAELLSALFPEGVPGFDASPGVTVLSRVRPAYDPLGIRLGAFTFWPQLEEAGGYDDNVLAGSRPQGSWTIITRPSLLINSNWSQEALGAYFSVADTRYPDLTAQGRTDATASVGGSINIGSNKLTLAAAHILQHQDRSEIDAVPSDQPITVQIDDARASFDLASGPWTITPSVELSNWRFGSTTIFGVPSDQSYRDRAVVAGTTTVRYDWAPLRSLLLMVRAIDQRYIHEPHGKLSNDSVGYQAWVGLDYDDNAVWRYRLLVGGESRQFAAFGSHNDVIAEAEATWSPSGLTTIHAALSRSIEDAAQEGVAGFTYTSGRITIDHEYFRNVILSASTGVQRAVFLQTGTVQNGYSVGIGATWLVNRTMRVSATYDVAGIATTHSGTTSLIGDYARQVGLLTLRFGL